MPPPAASHEQQGWEPLDDRRMPPADEWNQLHDLQAQYPDLLKQVSCHRSIDVVQ